MNNSTPADFKCPALMNDGRYGTDYRPTADANLNIQKANNIQDNNDYRAFLVNNATAIMQQNLKDFENNARCMQYQNTVDPNGADQVWEAYSGKINYSPVL
jgi:hypothetical protein